MLRIGSIVLGVSDIERAKKFWMAAIDYEPRDLDDDCVVLQDPDGNKFCVIQKESTWKGFEDS